MRDIVALQGANKMTERNLGYEKKFRAYLFSGCGDRQQEICEHINVVPSTEKTREAHKNGF